MDSVKKPVQSKRVYVRSVRSDSANQTQVMAAKPGGTIMKKAERQFDASVAIDPNTGPSTGPNTAPMPHITNAVACRWRGNEASKIA